jgi:ATP-dependent RNA helicase DDX31/DBP7
MFLYAHQHVKVIVFASNCETVNFLYRILTELDWRNCINKRGREETKVVDFENQPEDAGSKRQLFEGKVYKLHGDMDHSERKVNYLQFDKNDQSLLVCTDVASRGLDFKGIEWVLQWDLSSTIKDYVNRVGRTARIAANGQSICFVMQNEHEYVQNLKDKYAIDLIQKSRFILA